mmetsp:Transcript_32805/g.76299  ORF Transcript_32805/g.76299 Transcript_32805/m.76299 type:complete len:607 (-) Transcript_32805:210-2030(-)
MQLFASAAFARLVLVPMFNAGETIFVQQTRRAGEAEGTLWLLSVWLSASVDPDDRDAMLVNLTDKLTALPSSDSSVRFSFVAVACKECVLHVTSLFNPGTNSSPTNEDYVHASMLLQMPSPSEDVTTAIRGTLFLIAIDPEIFAADPSAQMAVAVAIRAVIELPLDATVVVGLAVVPSDVQASPAPSSARAVRATYSITIPVGGLSDGRNADGVVNSLWSVGLDDGLADVEGALHDALTDIASTRRYIVTVTGLTQRVELQPPSVDHEPDRIRLPTVLLVVASVVFCACCALAWRLGQRRRRAWGASGELQPPVLATLAPEPSQDQVMSIVTDDAAWTLSETLDGAVLACMEKLFNPALDTSGRGRATQLLIRRVWVVEALALWQDYDSAKRRLKAQLQGIQLASTQGVGRSVGQSAPTQTLADAVSAQLDLDESCNEKMLLHGTTPKRVRAILHDGVDERNTAFGYGAFLVEDPSKSYEEAQADTPEALDEETKQLHETLYKEGTHPGEVFYTFACQVLLGCTVHTQGPASCPVSIGASTSLCPAGTQVFVDGSRRQLVNVPGAAFPFHSLVVEKGGVPQREFVVFDRKTVFPKYLVAYGCRESL